jgi:hypothetical protein
MLIPKCYETFMQETKEIFLTVVYTVFQLKKSKVHRCEISVFNSRLRGSPSIFRWSLSLFSVTILSFDRVRNSNESKNEPKGRRQERRVQGYLYSCSIFARQ